MQFCMNSHKTAQFCRKICMQTACNKMSEVYKPDYYLLSENTWTASEAEAVALGGHLVTVNDATEQAFLVGQFGNFGGVQANLWIGLNDVAIEGVYTWVSGEPVLYTNFAPGEPNGFFPDEDYVHMLTAVFDPSGGWNDSRDLTFPFGTAFPPARGIVEVASVPDQPSTLVLSLVGLGALAAYRRWTPRAKSAADAQ